MKKEKSIHNITVPLINLEILFIFNHDNMKEAVTWFDKKGAKRFKEIIVQNDFDSNKGGGACVITHLEPTHSCETVVVLFDDTTHKTFLPTVVHEITHIMQFIREKFWRDKEEMEFEAYIAQYLFTEILNVLDYK